MTERIRPGGVFQIQRETARRRRHLFCNISKYFLETIINKTPINSSSQFFSYLACFFFQKLYSSSNISLRNSKTISGIQSLPEGTRVKDDKWPGNDELEGECGCRETCHFTALLLPAVFQGLHDNGEQGSIISGSLEANSFIKQWCKKFFSHLCKDNKNWCVFQNNNNTLHQKHRVEAW